jgi:hypothetical protein
MAAMAMASRPALRKRDGCTPNKLEAFHLGHGHGTSFPGLLMSACYGLICNTDVNSGDVKVKEGSIEHLGLKVPGGTGCKPDWSKVPAYNSVKGKKGAGGARSAEGQYKM